MLRKLIIALSIVALLITQAVATEYLADLSAKQIQIDGSGTKSWVTSTRTLHVGEEWAFGSVNIKYSTIESTNDRIWFVITGTSITTSNLLLTEGGVACLRGTCSENMTIVSDNAVSMTLSDIRPTSTSFNGTTSDDPVYAYVYINKEIPLIKDDVANVDVQKTRQETGVSYSKTTSEVYVYFTRKQSVPISISVKAESRTPKNEEWTSDRVKFTIDSSGTYTFTVKYKKTNVWGAETDITEIYGLKLINLGDGSSTSSGVSKYKSTVYLPDTLVVDMGTAGSFTPQSGVSTTLLSGSEYRIVFDSEGVYRLKYTTSGGTAVDDAVVATIRAQQPTAKPTETKEATEEFIGNQQQGGEEGSNWWIYGIALVILLIIIGYALTRKKMSGTYNIKAQ